MTLVKDPLLFSVLILDTSTEELKQVYSYDIEFSSKDLYSNHVWRSEECVKFIFELVRSQHMKPSTFNNRSHRNPFIFPQWCIGLVIIIQDVLMECWSRILRILNHFNCDEDNLVLIRKAPLACPFLRYTEDLCQVKESSATPIFSSLTQKQVN